MEKNVKLKLILLGESGSGKTSIMRQYCNGTFDENPLITIGNDFGSRTITVNDIEVKISIWDTSGGEAYKNICWSYARHADGVIFVFDLTQPSSFTSLNYIYNKVTNGCSFKFNNPYPFLIVGNKTDLNKKTVSQYTIDNYKDSNNINLYYDVSAKTGENLDKAFYDLVKLILERTEPEPDASVPIEHIDNENTQTWMPC
ncbi:ras-related protein Rab-7a [Histomonas meleagridis]|uniref:ras-related protein Rab-7a n=1 Tax=Histomonas meleagridis TaxID=135588 RepID=UPI00355A90D0|nr:ras-related protein Rab-7a [Histomonas meleagridis]KAH0806017.1 ras-related protein Rab-7a [Histomonas meleagridis]